MPVIQNKKTGRFIHNATASEWEELVGLVRGGMSNKEFSLLVMNRWGVNTSSASRWFYMIKKSLKK